jgi:hypothetical protein
MKSIPLKNIVRDGNQTIRYIIIAEFEKIGFVTEMFNHYDEAEDFCLNLHALGRKYNFNDWHKVVEELQERKYVAYQINNAPLVVCKTYCLACNGVYTVAVMQIDLDKFCVKSFMSERTNAWTGFEYSKLGENITEPIIQYYPGCFFSAN